MWAPAFLQLIQLCFLDSCRLPGFVEFPSKHGSLIIQPKTHGGPLQTSPCCPSTLALSAPRGPAASAFLPLQLGGTAMRPAASSFLRPGPEDTWRQKAGVKGGLTPLASSLLSEITVLKCLTFEIWKYLFQMFCVVFSLFTLGGLVVYQVLHYAQKQP